MNDEIKEILDRINNYPEKLYCLNEKEKHLLLDYITNLQQENKSLTEQLEYLRSGEYLNQVKWERDLNENLNQTMSIELIDYKSRCEKAIEYINKQDMSYYGEVVETKMGIILHILQNGSDSQ